MSSSTVISDYIGRGSHAARPASPPIGSAATAIYFETDTGFTFVWSGSSWINTSGNPGTVTSVALSVPGELSVGGSPITTSGTLALSWASQAGNKVFAAPSGSSGSPGFRLLVAQDIPTLDASQITTGVFSTSFIPNLDASKITTGLLSRARGGTGVDTSTAANGQLLIGTGSGVALSTLTAGSGVTITNSSGGITIASTGSGGTVTSVALSMPGEYSVSGSPITGTGTLTVTKANQSANLIYAGPSTGAAAAPTFRGLVAADIPTLDTSKLTTGILLPSRGGTGLDSSSASNGQLLIGNGSGFSLATLTAGSNVTITNASGTITIASTGGGGGGSSTPAPAVRVKNSAAITITNGVDNTLTFDTTEFDQGTSLPQHSTSSNPSRLTCQQAGVYQITATIQWNGAITSETDLHIRLNGATDIGYVQYISGGGDARIQNVTTLYRLAIGDYVEVNVANNNSRNIGAFSETSPTFMMARVDTGGTGAVYVPVVKTSNDTILPTDSMVVAGANGLTLTLPAASAYTGKSPLVIKNDNFTATIVAAAGSDTIDGAASFTVSNPYDSLSLVSDSVSVWRIV